MSEDFKSLISRAIGARNMALSRARKLARQVNDSLAFDSNYTPLLQQAKNTLDKLLKESLSWKVPFDFEMDLIESILPDLQPYEASLRTKILAWDRELHQIHYILGMLGSFLNRKIRLKHTTQIIDDVISLPDTTLEQIRSLNMKILLSEIILQHAEVKALPLTYCIDPSSSCNYRCRTCFQSETQQYYQSMLSTQILSTLKPALPFAFDVKLFGIGEPTLSPQFPLFCEIIAQSKTRANLLTNGSTLGKRKIPYEALSALGISFDGAEKRTFEAIRVGAQFDTLLERIAEARKAAPDICIYLNATINRVNVDEIAGIARIAAELGANRVNYTKMIPYGRNMRERDLALTQEDIPLLTAQLIEAREICNEHGIVLDSSILTDDLPLQREPRDKEKFLKEFESIEVVGSGAPYSFEQIIEMLEGKVIAPYPDDEECLTPVKLGLQEASPDLPTKPTFWITDVVQELEQRLRERVKLIKLMPENMVQLPYCSSPWVKMFIEAEGTLKPCCVYPMHSGDIAQSTSFESAWNSPELVQLRKTTVGRAEIHSKCKECNFAERYLMIDLLLNFLEECGKDLTQIQVPEKYFPPEYIKKRLNSLRQSSSV